MIDDIVVLPRRYDEHKRDHKVSSEQLYTYPISAIGRHFGYESPDDSVWSMYGSKTTVPTGKDAWYRLKIIENTTEYFVEYYCLADKPVDPMHLNRCSTAIIYAIWATFMNRKTGEIEHKYVFWRNVFALTRYETEDTAVDVPVEAAIGNEVFTFARIYGFPDLVEAIMEYPTDMSDVIISEVQKDSQSDVDKLRLLRSNIKAYSDLADMGSLPDWSNPLDIFRGINLPRVWTNLAPTSSCYVIALVQFGPVALKDLMFLVSPAYCLHLAQRPIARPTVAPDTVFDITSGAEGGELFTLIKYVDELPYKEFKLVVKSTGEFRLILNTKTGSREITKVSDLTGRETTGARITSILESARATNPKQELDVVTVKKSWGEEIYITILFKNGDKRSYYFDSSVATLCSRSLLKDYDLN